MGAPCWVLHPGHGCRPVAEGIAGNKPPSRSREEGICQSLLMELCEDGQQMVKLTKVHKKNIELMFPDENASSKFLESYVVPPASSNTSITWSTRYLVEKDDDG